MRSKIILSGNYEIFDNGEIKKTNNGRINMYQLNGYKTFSYKGKTYYIHRLVAESFIPNINNYPIINHIDGNKQNNNVNNLEWCTYSHNMKEAYKNNQRKPNKTTSKNKPIIMLDENKEEICIFRKMKYTNKLFQKKVSPNIIRGIKKGTKEYGYYWKYL